MPTQVTIPWGNAFRQFYDRGATRTILSQEIVAGASVRALTIDATYTVPAARAAWLAAAWVHTEQESFLALNAVAETLIRVTLSGGSALSVARATLHRGEANVARDVVMPAGVVLASGDTVSLASLSDNSAVGTNVIHKGAATIVEFDAS